MERVNDYIGFRNRVCDIVHIGWEWFDYRNDEDELPVKGAFCKNCARETAKPVYPIYMNCKAAYALQCKKCGGEYPMYKHTYIQRYVGYDTPSGGHVNPTHGLISHAQAMDRKAREYSASIPQRVEDSMCKQFNLTHEEYREMKKKWEEDEKEAHKRFERREAERRAKYRDKEIQEKSAKRKELIEKGILKYVKGVGLVNTETNEVVKL